MAKSSSTTTRATTTPAPAAPAARTSVYRTREDFLAALGAAKGLTTGNPAYAAAVRVLTHLAWRGPAGSVAWHKGTNADMVANAASLGATPGTPMATAIAGVVDGLEAAADTEARTTAAQALRASLV